LILQIDYETRSRVDLKKSGVYRYAQDASTAPWCMAYAFGDEEPQIWKLGEAFPEEIADRLVEVDQVRGWNVGFERVIWKVLCVPRFNWPRLPNELFYDTAAEAAAMALPRALNKCAQVLNTPCPKDDAGHRLMMQMSKPRKPTKKDPREWWDEADKLDRLYDYCKQDVRAERAVAARLRPLSLYEREVYLHTEAVNDRGVRLDRELILASQRMVEIGTVRANALMDELTKGEVTSVTKVKDLTQWLQRQGVEIENVRKDTIRDLLTDGDVEGTALEAIQLRADSAKSSTAKINAMQNCVCKDGRARALLLYHGAGTGRDSGKLIQPQNFPAVSNKVKGAEKYIPAVLKGDYDLIDTDYPVLTVISGLLRSMLVASKGCRLMSADYAQIEARVLAWIAEQNDLVEAFADGGKIYEPMAAKIYNIPVEQVTKDGPERDIGKKTILGAGFQMGAETFKNNTKIQTGVVLSDELAEAAIKAYREMYPRIKQFWYDIERAAIKAVKKPGESIHVGRGGAIQYVVRGKFLWCILPSGRPLCYALPRVERRTIKPKKGDPFEKDSLSYRATDGVTKQWKTFYAYGGLLTENVVQAMARDLMVAGSMRVEKAGYPVVLRVHDEIVADVPSERGTLEEFVRLIKVKPHWAEGLPVAAEGWEGLRYRK
jgi:DNA polymerase